MLLVDGLVGRLGCHSTSQGIPFLGDGLDVDRPCYSGIRRESGNVPFEWLLIGNILIRCRVGFYGRWWDNKSEI